MKLDNRGITDASQPFPANFDMRREAWLTAYAETSCQIVEALSSLLVKGAISEGTPEYFGAVNTIYIVYGRPFHRCAGVGQLDKTDIPSDRTTVHDHLMTFRDKVYAHKDTCGIQIDEEYTANEVRVAVNKDGQMRFFCTEFYTRPPQMTAIRDHAGALQSHFGQRMKTLNAQLLASGKPPCGVNVCDGEFILSVDRAEETPFKRVQDCDAYVYKRR